MSHEATNVHEILVARRRRWVVTGAAGFIGSHLVQGLLEGGQDVTGLDNFATGRQENLQEVQAKVGLEAWSRFCLLEGDIEDSRTCDLALEGADYVLHHAALVSVPLSIEKPELTTRINVGGFANILAAAKRAGVKRVIYASSSAVYGDASGPSNREGQIGEPLSPYALTKYVNELQAKFYTRAVGLSTIGLRYFNVFGPRQNAKGGYAAVIPLWVESALKGDPCRIYGDGTSTRDFCYVSDILQANLRAALTPMTKDQTVNAFNIGTGKPVSLLELHKVLMECLEAKLPGISRIAPVHEPPRPGDIQHSTADPAAAEGWLGFHPRFTLAAGLSEILDSRQH